MEPAAMLGAPVERVPLDGPKVHHISGWADYDDPTRMSIITNIAKQRGRDPRIATLAVKILREAGVQPRDYVGQSKALLKWVQNKLYYVNEPGERLQDPLYTLRVGYGDCDDLVIMLGSLLESIRMPWKVVISGNHRSGKKIRYHHGERFPGGPERGNQWSHIYLMVGNQPFTPTSWSYAEVTLRGAPLGWDVVDGDHSLFPELQPKRKRAMYGSMHLNPGHYSLNPGHYDLGALAFGAMDMSSVGAGLPAFISSPRSVILPTGITIAGFSPKQLAVIAGAAVLLGPSVGRLLGRLGL
tara:strand:+ start:735 stop:1628 length:894 start_codon:yes stop_codon:yes gene_type:complete